MYYIDNNIDETEHSKYSNEPPAPSLLLLPEMFYCQTGKRINKSNAAILTTGSCDIFNNIRHY